MSNLKITASRARRLPPFILLLCLLVDSGLNATMPRQIPGRIRNNFTEYRRFISEAKTIEHARIKMAKGGSRKNFLGRSGVVYSPIQGDKAFEVEISVEDNAHYHLRLFSYWFDDGPCFRFDSKGRSHCNPENGQGLRKRQIHAPHFHRFDEEEKVEIAYQTQKLKGTDANLIVRDYKRGLEHFCQEASLACSPSGFPFLEIEQGEFDLSSEDPQNGVKFV